MNTQFTHNLLNLQHYFKSSDSIVTTKGNLSRLRKTLEENRVDKEDIHELISIVKSEEPDVENRQLGERANDWILKVFGKAVNGVGKINRGLRANSLATLIKEYYGIVD
jgi:hypothetical protein